MLEHPVHAGDPDVGDPDRLVPQGVGGHGGLLGHGQVGRSRGDDRDRAGRSAFGARRTHDDQSRAGLVARVGERREDRVGMLRVGPCHEHRAARARLEGAGRVDDLRRGLALRQHRFGRPGAQLAMMVDPQIRERLEGEVAEPVERVGGPHVAGGDVVEQLGERAFVHGVGHRIRCPLANVLLTGGAHTP